MEFESQCQNEKCPDKPVFRIVLPHPVKDAILTIECPACGRRFYDKRSAE